MDIKNITEIKNHRIDSKFLVITIVSLVLFLLISSSILSAKIIKDEVLLNQERERLDCVTELKDKSDYLTYKVYSYVVTGNKEYYDAYMYEINVSRSREKALDEFIKLGASAEEEEILTETIELSNELAAIEMEAFELIEQGDLLSAQSLIYSYEYGEYKNEIFKRYEFLKSNISERIEVANHDILKATKATFLVAVFVAIGTVIATILLVFTLVRIKRDSDIDSMTGLQNRNKYKENIKILIDKEPTKFGALIYCDIDNLKFINDCYGHVDGDRYIQAMATVISEFAEYKSVIARPSGDEFIAYIHGFDSEKDVIEVITTKMLKMRNSYFLTTLHIEEKIRFSTGISLYPSDTESVEELIKYADYAMFKMKKNSKGEVAFYDKTTIDKTLYLARNSGVLDDFLEKELLDFAVQPIVHAQSFEIYGYEFLMRPNVDLISSPFLLLELAKHDSKLDKLERICLKKAIEKIENNSETFDKYKIFINSIADQVLTDEIFEECIGKHLEVLKNVVIEVTEQQYVEEAVIKGKIEKFRELGALIALDDYGSGYSNEYSLLSGLYDIIKIDRSIVNNVDTDVKRQEIVKSLIKVSKINGYKVLAEGIETASEVKTLQNLGVDYLQGYFIGKPDLEIKGISNKAMEYIKKI